MMWGYGDGWNVMGGWGWGWHGPFSFLWILILVFLGIGLLRMVFGHRHGKDWRRHGPPPHWRGEGGWQGPRRSSGLAILEERYAKGEINRDEYLEKRRDLLGEAAA
ncbi:MAG: SHOCT domain-containing protein [Bauldia sp.]